MNSGVLPIVVSCFYTCILFILFGSKKITNFRSIYVLWKI